MTNHPIIGDDTGDSQRIQTLPRTEGIALGIGQGAPTAVGVLAAQQLLFHGGDYRVNGFFPGLISKFVYVNGFASRV